VNPIVDNGFLRPFTVSPLASDPGVAGLLKFRVGLGARTQVVELVLPLLDVIWVEMLRLTSRLRSVSREQTARKTCEGGNSASAPGKSGGLTL